MTRLLGYGEDALTLWALQRHISDILKAVHDETTPSDCLIYYRPSFGRSGGTSRAEFGEFDAILASSENIYLIESKWDNLSTFKNDELTIEEEQELRHRIFSWYVTHWDEKYSNDWESFIEEQMDDFQKEFPEKRIAPANSLLAENLRFILTMLKKHCKGFSSRRSIQNVLCFFYNRGITIPPNKISRDFNLVSIDYSQEIVNNFITLERHV